MSKPCATVSSEKALCSDVLAAKAADSRPKQQWEPTGATRWRTLAIWQGGWFMKRVGRSPTSMASPTLQSPIPSPRIRSRFFTWPHFDMIARLENMHDGSTTCRMWNYGTTWTSWTEVIVTCHKHPKIRSLAMAMAMELGAMRTIMQMVHGGQYCCASYHVVPLDLSRLSFQATCMLLFASTRFWILHCGLGRLSFGEGATCSAERSQGSMCWFLFSFISTPSMWIERSKLPCSWCFRRGMWREDTNGCTNLLDITLCVVCGNCCLRDPWDHTCSPFTKRTSPAFHWMCSVLTACSAERFQGSMLVFISLVSTPKYLHIWLILNAPNFHVLDVFVEACEGRIQMVAPIDLTPPFV